jgi:acetyl esterase/lipase
LLAACGTPAPEASAPSRPRSRTRRVAYGDHPDQYAVLATPKGAARGLVVLVHGGFWSDAYGLDLMDPLARDLAGRGYATWNVEYRRLGTGGGFPHTFADVATAIDQVPGLGLDTGLPVTTVGHSAGGHLAVWAASRSAATPGGPPRFTATTTVSLSGVLCLATADLQGIGGGAAGALMGGHFTGSPSSYDLADPVRLTPARGILRVLHARDDQVVPPSQSADYVAADAAAGGTARLVTVPGDHFALIDPSSTAWLRTTSLIEEPSSPAPPRS